MSVVDACQHMLIYSGLQEFPDFLVEPFTLCPIVLSHPPFPSPYNLQPSSSGESHRLFVGKVQEHTLLLV